MRIFRYLLIFIIFSLNSIFLYSSFFEVNKDKKIYVNNDSELYLELDLFQNTGAIPAVLSTPDKTYLLEPKKEYEIPIYLESKSIDANSFLVKSVEANPQISDLNVHAAVSFGSLPVTPYAKSFVESGKTYTISYDSLSQNRLRIV